MWMYITGYFIIAFIFAIYIKLRKPKIQVLALTKTEAFVAGLVWPIISLLMITAYIARKVIK